MEIKILDSANQNKWDKFVNSHPKARFVHLSVYKDIIEKTYGYKGYFLYAEQNEEIVFVFPFFKVKTIFLRDKFISQPFSEYGGILFKQDADERQKKEAISNLEAFLKKTFLNQKNFCIEIHGQEDEANFVNQYSDCKNLHRIAVLKLGPYKDIYDGFDRQIRKSINKARRGGLKVYEDTSLESIRNKFYSLYFKHLKKRHGVPPYSLEFFLNCYRIAPKKIRIYFAEFKNKTVAALWGFLADNRIHISYNPSLKEYFDFRPNDLIHAEFIKWACENEFTYFDFGPASYPGQIYYKKKWGVDFINQFNLCLFGKAAEGRHFNHFLVKLIKKVSAYFWKHLIPDGLAKMTSGIIRKKLGR
jgi:CelD/BcsL family acetyltransferase involved in cellulose biosynthesis